MIESTPSGTILYGRYRIERVLGSGGFGHVYLAVDLRTNQQYAIKEYLVSGSTGQAQLEHEARVLSQLHHPNLPAYHEAFNERGRYYVVLSYIEGNDLTDIIRSAHRRNEYVDLQRIMGWLLSVCDAVKFLHSQQTPLIHRDIKPDNIRIMPNGNAVLVDLGNVKAADGARTLFFIRHQGTPGYAPREQYPGGSGTDVRSDVYALGATLLFALTAQEPPSITVRDGAIQQGQADLPTLQELLAKNIPDDGSEGRQFRLGVSKPAKPIQRFNRQLAQLTTLSPEQLDRLNKIIQRSMSMRPKERYQTVGELSDDLKRVIAAFPAPPSPPPQSNRALDPHGTQPDLPMLYEALQAAKAQNEQSNADDSLKQAAMPTIPPSPSSSSPAHSSTINCPQCGATMLSKAVFCSNCGNSLSNYTSNKNPTPPSQPNSKVNNSGKPNKPVEQDINSAPTMIITPQSPSGQGQTPFGPPPPSSPKPGTPPMSYPTYSQPPAAQNSARPYNNLITENTIPPAPSAPAMHNGNGKIGNFYNYLQPKPNTPNTKRNPSPGFQSKYLIIIAVIFLIIVLTVVALFFASQRPRAGYNSSSISQIHAIYGQDFTNEQRTSPQYKIDTVTHNFTGLWQRSQGIYSSTDSTQGMATT